MALPAGDGVVVYRRTGGPDAIDAIDEHSRRLVDALGAQGVEARYAADGLSSVVSASTKPSWVLLEYNPFRFGRRGFAPGLLRDALALRRRGVPLAIMVHEAWVDMTDWRTTVMGLWQRLQLGALLRVADAVMTSTEALAREIGHGAVHIPVASNITPVATSGERARAALGLDGRLVVAMFGRDHPSRALGHAEAAIAALADAHGPSAVVVLNVGADAPRLRVPTGVEIASPGRMDEHELSLRLSASDLVLLPFTDGLSTRRSTLAAALAHGRAVLGLHGRNTDKLLADASEALTLTPVGDPTAFAQAAVTLSRDPGAMRAAGDAGRRLYERRFDWPVAAQTVSAVLARMKRQPLHRAPERPAIFFVANDVGEFGGMERQSAELVRHLLDAGHQVTVLARRCDLAAHRRLRFVRVPTPRRPATLAYPLFVIAASLLAARRGDALLHTTGAIVLNRADVSTVHYCHRAAAKLVEGSRASRQGRLYRLNAAMAARLSRAGEAWCYRPARARMLCAVSSGVATELRTEFPKMAAAVRTVPNGVNAAMFRPDPKVRDPVRTELGLSDGDSLALFIGGDWERKGLRYAVDSLSRAVDWHLAVAGAGDPEPVIAHARSAGTVSRLHFLGPVRDTPRLYAAGDAFVLPTAYETFSLVTFEAAASGLPLLVTRVNGVEDLLIDGRNGWFIDRSGTDIAKRMRQLQTDPANALDMGARARADAVAYSWDAMAKGYVSIYRELLGETGRLPLQIKPEADPRTRVGMVR